MSQGRRHVLQLDTEIVSRQIEGCRLLVDDRQAIVQLGAIHLKVEERVGYGFVVRAFGFGMRLVGRAVGINDEMNDRMVSFQVVKADLRSKEGDDFHADEEPVDVRIRDLSRRFEAVDGEVVGLEFEAQQTPAEGPQLNPASCSSFKYGDHSLTYAIFKLRRARVPHDTADEEGGEREQYEAQLPPVAPQSAVPGWRGGDGIRCGAHSLILAGRAGALPVCRIQNLHTAFVAQALEPVLQQSVYMLLEQNFLDALR